MAFFDSPKILTAHLRHAFITSDDTGISEIIMINEDLDKEIKNDHTFSKKSLRMAQRYNPAEHYTRYAAKSYDIHASPTLSRRPPLKNKANMFEIVEERKRKKSAQCTTIAWQEGNDTFDPTLFPRQEIPKRPKDAQPSTLSRLLEEYDKRSANPFFEYSKFNGENHGVGTTNTYHIFLSMAKNRTRPITITVLHTASVSDLIGLTFWKFIEEKREKIQLKPVINYAVMIAEEDGDIDTDLPALERDDRIAKFRFKYLGIVETAEAKREESQPIQFKHIVVKVQYEQGGFSTLAVDSADVEMGEILLKVIKKRRLQMHGYELERKDSPGQAVDLSSTLESQGTLDFMLVKNIGRPRRVTSPESMDLLDSGDSPLGRRRVQTSVRAELTSHQYKSYHVVMIHKVRTNTEVHLGHVEHLGMRLYISMQTIGDSVSGEGIEIDPVGQSRSGISSFLRSSQKPTTYEIKKICACEEIDEKANQRTVFRIVRISKDGNYKNLDFEAPTATAKEIVRKINLVLDELTSGAKAGYSEWKEQLQARGRKGSKTSN